MKMKRHKTAESGIGGIHVPDASSSPQTPYQFSSSSNSHPASLKGFCRLPLELYSKILSNFPLSTLLELRLVAKNHARLVREFIEMQFRRGDYVLEVTLYESPLEHEERRERRRRRRKRGGGLGGESNRRSRRRAGLSMDEEESERRTNGRGAEYCCRDFTLEPGFQMVFLPKNASGPTLSDDDGSGEEEWRTSNMHRRGPGSSRTETSPVENQPTTAPSAMADGTEPHSSASSSSRDLERQWTRIKLRFRSPINNDTASPVAPCGGHVLFDSEDEPGTTAFASDHRRHHHEIRSSAFSSRAAPLFSATFPFHPRTYLGTHIWDHHRHSSVRITYTVEDLGAGSYALLIRSLTIMWAWLSRKVSQPRKPVRSVGRTLSSSTATSSSSASDNQTGSSTSPQQLDTPLLLPREGTSTVEFGRVQAPPDVPPSESTTNPARHILGSQSVAPPSGGRILPGSSPSRSITDNSSSLLYNTDTGTELWDSSDNDVAEEEDRYV